MDRSHDHRRDEAAERKPLASTDGETQTPVLDPVRAVSASLAEAWRRLDDVDALPVGSGHVNFGLTGRATRRGGLLGLGLDAQWRATKRMSLFGEVTAGDGYGEFGSHRGYDWFAQGLFGARVTF